MCIVWTFRQRRLGIDEFGHPLDREVSSSSDTSYDDGLVAEEEDDPAAIRAALAAALESAAESDVRSHGVREVEELPISEETPLLGSAKASEGTAAEGTWSSWFRR